MNDKPTRTQPQRVQDMMQVIGSGLDAENGDALARAAQYSRFYFQRLFRATVGEAPSEMQRRLRLERAAYRLRYTNDSITTIAFDTGYESLEGFTRAFRKAFRVSPSHYRRLEPLSWYLTAPNDVHYDPASSGVIHLMQQQGGNMNLTERMLQYDAWLTQRLLNQATQLNDAQLDAPLPSAKPHLAFEGPEKNLRELLNRIVKTKEIWLAAIDNRPIPETTDLSVPTMLQRFQAAFGQYAAVVRRVEQENKWDDVFVDTTCDPAESFTYGGMIAHVLVFGSYRCLSALRAFEALGVHELGYGDPIEWERELMNGNDKQA